MEKIEDRDEQPLSAFYKDTSLKIEKHSAYGTIFNNKKKFSTTIKQFVRKSFSDPKLNTAYLRPLNNFIRECRGLSVFSTNYDVCIEQFCNGITPYHSKKDVAPTLNIDLCYAMSCPKAPLLSRNY